MGDESGPLSDDFFQWGTGATIRELFRLFNKERGGTLSQSHYARFCQLTEGQGCDDARWAQHCRSLGVAEPAGGMPLGCFGKLYTQKRFKRHFGKVRSELQKVKEALAAPKPDATAAAPAKSAAAPAPRRAPSRRSLLRVGAAARLSSASFAEPGLLGIEWAAEAVLRPPDHVAEVLGELRAAADAAGAKPRGADNTAIASRGDLHPKAVVAGKRADAVPPPKGFAAFEPSPTFEGARDGYQFQLGSMGVGYYWYGGEAGRRAIARAKAQRADDSSESDEEDDDEVEYGCVIRGLRPDSMAAAAAAAGQGAALRVGMALKQVNAWPTDGQETDEIIEYIASQSRSPEHPLVLRFAPSASADSGKKEVKGKDAGAEESAAPPAKRRRTLKWADDAGGSTLEEMEPPALDMFGGAEASASSGKERQAPGDGREIGGQVLGPGVKAVPFHLRAAAEMAKFTAVQDAAKAKKARLETVRTIASRQEQQRQEMAAAAERQREEERVEDAAAAAELEAAQAGPKKWGLKRSREGEGDALRYGGAAV